ncbi:MAG TPA: tetratricopeptide repeat protein [Clostridiales bacterium]|nr:tetratricopeptide repeat protein [Clostridiales bacterium]
MTRELFAKAKGKIIPFDQDGEFFYRKAKKYEENNQYIDALNFYRKAVEKDPDNLNYMLDLADTFTEMNYFEESNKILFSMLRRKKVLSDCYFGLGCNFLGLQDFNKAEECFDKYLQVDNNGIYSEDARYLLAILQDEEFFFQALEDIDLEDEQLYDMANKGKIFMDRGEYKKAIKQLKKVVKRDPSMVFARNNLALAYFCIGDLDNAIDTTLKMLEDFPLNVHALCNMALFLHENGELERAEDYIQGLMDMSITDGEDIHKIAVTLCELKRHSEAYRYLKLLLQYKPYDVRVLHYIAVASFNLKRYSEALSYWDKVSKISPRNTISAYYRRYTLQVLKGQREIKEISYNYQVPYDEMVNRVKRINEYINMPSEEQRQRWLEDDTIYNLFNWGIALNDDIIKRAILATVSNFKDGKAENFLRNYILKRNEKDEQKREALAYLKRMDAKEPYVAYINDSVVEVKVSIIDLNKIELPSKYKKVFEFTIETMAERYETGYEDYIEEIWSRFIKSLYPDRLPRIYKIETWAATLEYYYCTQHDIDVSKNELARLYNITPNSINNNLKKLEKIIEI